jgi:glycosyltransferase involved in cell wall biosynthesis
MAEVKQRIALVLPDLRLGGAQRVLLLLAREFLAAGRQVDIVSLVDDGQLIADLPAGVAYRALTQRGKSSGAWLAMGAIPGLIRYLREQRPDAVLSSMTGTNLLTVLAHIRSGRCARLVLREAASIDNTRSRMTRWLMRMFYRRADNLLAVSTGVADDLVQLGLDERAIRIIHNPVDAGQLRMLAAEGKPLPSLHGASYIVSIGRLTEQKDHRTLLRAYATSALRHSHRLVIVGEGEERLALETLAHELGIQDRFDLPGAMANPYRVLKDAALHVLSSRWEGYPNVLLEALALGVPVVATDCAAGPRELLEGGRYGRLAPLGDHLALAHAMEEGLAQPSCDAAELLDAHRPHVIANSYLVVLDGRLKESGT